MKALLERTIRVEKACEQLCTVAMPGLGRRLQRDVAQALAIPGQFNEQRR